MATEITLTWQDTSNGAGIGYNIFRSTTSGAESTTPINAAPVQVANTGTMTYVDTGGLVAGTTYFYKIQAVNVATPTIVSALSAEVSVLFPLVTPAPAAPTGLKAVAS